jgi:DNA (cytosine-5)-methyltransferase 1
MRYGSVCSGIEAASVAWHPLGWEPAFFSEIEAFPRAVLAHRFPHVPLHGDFTTIKGDEYGPIDLLVGGTPCQSFSVAGLRGGLADDRGNLALEFLLLAQRTRARWLVWENVPGVLSSNGGRDFGAILGGMVELGYGIAYRVLDAQFFGVPQRRRRVFVVGYLGDWRRAAAVLFERQSLSGDPAPRREKGKNAPTLPSRSTAGGGLGTDFDLDGGLIPYDVDGCVNSLTANNGQRNEVSDVVRGSGIPWPAEIAPTLNAAFGDKQGLEDQHALNGAGLFVTHALRGEGFDASEDGTGRGTPIVPVGFNARQDPDHWHDRTGPLDTDGSTQAVFDPNQITSKTNRSVPTPGICHTLTSTGNAPVAFSCKDHGADAGDTAPTLRAMGHANSHANAGGQLAAVTGTAVRRLTPRECERLQGFPDDWTLVPHRGKPAADGPRYKALGNSMAVPCMRWIGERIAMIDDLG